MLTSIGRFIVPADIDVRKRRLELLLWSFLLSLAFYPGPWGFLAWLSLVRPILILIRLKPRAAFRSAYFFSFCFNAFSLYWVALVTPSGTMAAVLIISFYYTAVLMVFHRLHAVRPWLGFIALPFLWTGMEHFRTLSQFAFPWSDLGYTQAHYLYILQIVSVISVHGLTVLLVAVNVLLAQLFRPTVSLAHRYTCFLVSLAVVAVLTAYGWIQMPVFPRPGKIDVALMQGSVPMGIKWAEGKKDLSFQIYDSLAQSVADTATRLFVWPETSAPCYLSHDRECRATIANIARASNGYHLVGALGASWIDGKQRHFNSCYQFTPQGLMEQRYDKVKLVPFSEQSPYQDYIPFLRQEFLSKYLTFIKTYDIQWWSDFYPGHSSGIFQLPETSYGVLICFECTFPEYTRKMILDGADFLVGITNDTWFGSSVGIHMHSRIFVTRAVENRIWMARAANSGLTYIVDAYGRIRDELKHDDVNVLAGKVRTRDEVSIFTTYGDVAGKVSFLILVLSTAILSISWVIRKFRH